MKLIKSQNIMFLSITLLMLASLACRAATDIPSTPEKTATPTISVSLEVFNETQKPLCYLLISPSDDEFSKEYLDGLEIAPGKSHKVNGFEVGEYNVKIHDCDKKMVNALYYVKMDKEKMTWTIREATLKVVNESSQPMCELYISPSSAPEAAWGPNQLGEGETFEPDMYASFSIAQGKWDIRVVPCDKSADAIKEIGLKVEGEFTYTLSDK